jgi:hypothetical protein
MILMCLLASVGARQVLKSEEVHQILGEAAHYNQVPRSTPEAMHLAQGALEIHQPAHRMSQPLYHGRL